MTNFTPTFKSASLISSITKIALLILLMFSHASAQSATDGSTPAGLKPGSPSGSYALSGFDNVNPYNGGLNFHLPLLNIGGRGSAGYTMTLPIEHKWLIGHYYSQATNQHFYWPDPNWWGNGISPGFSPGVMQARSSGIGAYYCENEIEPRPRFHHSLTRLTFTGNDGTEYELRDQLTNGKPADEFNTRYCLSTGYNRGKVFVTSDGTAATFIADQDVIDSIYGDGFDVYTVSGYLMMRDGTRYRFDNGLVSWIRDRNGNKVTFTYGTSMPSYGAVTTITDSLNRQVTIQYDATDAQYGAGIRITYSGFGGASRSIFITGTNLGNALRSGYSTQTFNQLFGFGGTEVFNPGVTSSVWLPDGRRYRFLYNSYGELARVELPTGGAIEYDHTGGLLNGPASGAIVVGYFDGGAVNEQVYRRVVERRVYKNSGDTTPESKTVFSRPESSIYQSPYISTLGYVDMEGRAGDGTLLTMSRHYYYGGAAASMAQNPIGYSAWKEGREYKTEIYNVVNGQATSVLHRNENTWQQRAAVSWWSWWVQQYPAANIGEEPSNDTRLAQTVNTLVDTNQVTQQTFSYDQYNNQTDVYEYDYGTGAAGSLVRRSHTDYLTTNPVNGADYASTTITSSSIHIRSLPTQQSIYDANNVERARITYEYDNYAPDTYHAALVDRPGISGLDAAFTILYGTRGNATRVSRWLLSSGTSINAYTQYDIAGNVTSTIDGRGKTTTIGYADLYSDNINRFTYAFPTSTASPIPDPAGTYGTNTALTAITVYDFSTGLVTSSTDANGKTTYLDYNDPLDRLKTVTHPAGGGTTAYYYNDVAGNLYVRTRTSLDDTRSVEAYQFFDNLGRTTRTFLNEGGSPVKFITTDTQYDALGRVWRVSNPYRTNGSLDPVNPSGNWTTTAYDALGRVKTVTSPDSAQIVSTYSGNQVTVQDQAGKVRSSVTDALGRLRQVTEAPTSLAYQTYYSYDVLDNLHTVAQDMPPNAQYPQGVQQRRYFMYDSLSRLIRAKNPEQTANANLVLADSISGNSQWSFAYTYDNNSNLATKTDARGVTASYTYDNINRNTYISYSDATPAVSRNYDGAVNGRGRFWYSFSGFSHTANDNYDDVGRPLSLRQHFYANNSWGNGFVTSRTYDKAGHVVTQTYPSGRTVNYAYDAAGRTNNFTGNLGDGVVRTYADTIIYDEWSGLSRERFGTDTPIYHKEQRNKRGQLFDIRLSTVNDDLNWNRGVIVNYYSFQPYGFGTSGPDNNGNLLVQQHGVPGDDAISTSTFMQQNYDYDALNRLIWTGEFQNGATHTGAQNYSYDRYGNRIVSGWGTGINGQQFVVDANTNRLGVPSGTAGVMQYDSSGNLINDTYSGAGSRTYDAENRMVTATNNSSQQSAYTYDADGKRVRRKSYGQEIWQVYGIDGELLAEYPANTAPSLPQKEYGYRNGQLLVIAEGGANAVSDFSATQNNGTWKYGSKTISGSTFNAFLSNANLFGGGLDSWSPGYCCPMITRNATGTTYTYPGAPSVVQPADVLNLHPGPGGEKSVVRWTAPAAGTYTIAGRFQGIDTAGTTTDVTILHNTTAVFASNVNGYGNQVTFSVTRTVAAGDTIDFQVGYGSNNSYGSDSTGLAATITPQSGGNLQWLVADQLGTARMVADRTGSLAGIKRHDYLPFGEELFAGTGGRTTGQGYVADNVRQKFTQYERDIETGLDYAQARYYASAQGRFNSTDPLYYQAMMAIDPQRFNLYAYARNNPLKFTDPNGEKVYLFGDKGWLTQFILYEMVGGQENFDRYFEVKDGEVKARPGVDTSGANAGVQELMAAVRADWNYVYFAGTSEDASKAAALFRGATNKKGKLTSFGQELADRFMGFGSRRGYLIGTAGRYRYEQPADLANGDPVWAVIAYNKELTLTQYGVDKDAPIETLEAQKAGVGQVVRPSMFFYHETAENNEFARTGVSEKTYPRAHAHAQGREAILRRELPITGGFAGGLIRGRFPSDQQ